ncbi:hypothetical protein SAMN05661044_00472 [Olivibacter domesticus]|uniref:Uncharacterized protein n=1 Tax=Olivibacter domesticus TaxID=407022 RepID=A0A1H7HSU6_OLID1|nr:hypothetical protein SAMN05661044_00472 [Olivibacter domesticus]
MRVSINGTKIYLYSPIITLVKLKVQPEYFVDNRSSSFYHIPCFLTAPPDYYTIVISIKNLFLYFNLIISILYYFFLLPLREILLLRFKIIDFVYQKGRIERYGILKRMKQHK